MSVHAWLPKGVAVASGDHHRATALAWVDVMRIMHRSQVPDQRDIYFDFQGDFVHHSIQSLHN